jgi:hypothetical protein
MNKTQYEILKFIQTEYQSGTVGAQKIKEAFPQVGDAYHYLRWHNRQGYTEETIRIIEGYHKHFYFVTGKGEKALLEFEASEIVSDDKIENIRHLAGKYSDLTTAFVAEKLLIANGTSWKLIQEAVELDVIFGKKEGVTIYYNLVDGSD